MALVLHSLTLVDIPGRVDRMRNAKGSKKVWLFLLPLASSLIDPSFIILFSSETILHPPFSEPLSIVSPPLPRHPSGAASSISSEAFSPSPLNLDPREEKILKILSNFRTGLRPNQKTQLAVLINLESRRYGFDPELIAAIISTESSFYNWSTSSMGAIGLMQIIPTTGKEMAEIHNIPWKGEERLLDPFLNIKLGVHYLATLYRKFGDMELALTAYNYGPGAVMRLIETGKKIPTNYSNKVLSYYQSFMDFDLQRGEGPSAAKETGKGSRS
ncbi:MAG TPA: lytic transglycosylase domain-containing protein [Candidatus Manganitrophaceae bacterium]